MKPVNISDEQANTREHFFDSEGNALFHSQSEIIASMPTGQTAFIEYGFCWVPCSLK